MDTSKKKTFSCIVPAHDEAPRIGDVLRTLLACPELDEVIVVDDASTDGTWDAIGTVGPHPGLVAIRLDRNVGKTRAIFEGVRAAKGDAIVMIDADLLNLRPEHVSALVAPVKRGEADVTLSLRENSLATYKLLRNDFVSGERVVPRAVFDDEGYYLSGPGYGLEVKMNERVIAAGYRVRSVYFEGVIAPRKSYKCGYVKGTVGDLKMVREILSVMPAHRLAYQLWYFYRQQREDDGDAK